MAKKIDWISCYIFHNISFEKVLTELIKPIIEKLEGKLISQYFFIRYWEKGSHVRLRVLPNDEILKDKVIGIIKKSSKNYFKTFKTNTKFHIEFNNYIQETQRYGGFESLKIAENHFQDSSSIILNNLTTNYKKWDYSMAISNAIQMHLVFVKNVLCNRDDSISYFDLLYKNMLINSIKLNDKGDVTKEELLKVNNFFTDSYNNQEKAIGYLVNEIWNKNQNNSWISTWSNNCKNLKKNIEESYLQNKLSTPDWVNLNENSHLSVKKQILWSIYDSYVHMTNNRLGIHLRDEAFIAFLLLQGLKNIS